VLAGAEVEEVAEHAQAGHEEEAHVLPAADGEEFAQDEGGVEEGFVELLSEAEHVLWGDGRGHDGSAHVVVIVVIGEEPAVFFALAVEGGAGIGDDDGSLQGVNVAFAEESAGEIDRALGVLERFPRVAEHDGDMGFEAGGFAHAGAVFDLLEGEAFFDAVEGGLVAGFEAVEDEAEASLFHQTIEFFVWAVKAHIAAEDDFFIVAAFDHEVTEAAQPVACAHGAGVIENFLDGVMVNDMFDFGEEAFRGEGAVGAGGIEGVVPDTEGAFVPPAIAAAIDVGAGSVFKVAVFVGVELPAGEIAVNKGEVVKIVGELSGAGGGEGAAAGGRDDGGGRGGEARMTCGEPKAGGEGGAVGEMMDEIEDEEIVIAAGDDAVNRGVIEGFLREIGDVVAGPDNKRVGQGGAKLRGDLPMARDDRAFGFHEHDVRRALEEALLPFGIGPFFGDAVEPEDLVAVCGEVAGGVGRDHGIDIGGGVEVLELAVLREERDTFGGVNGWIDDGDIHTAGNSSGSRQRTPAQERSKASLGNGTMTSRAVTFSRCSARAKA